ncbi:MAG: ABC transporter ATP-binding protein [Bdellovibrionaceae bacterium]|nr:ABC transporter ATP-binding protein [Pseudobdellovibrionaceae bacterium]MDW8189669.1 ABC transporter ATP-binding protein [Pseudobdellovibrionaceae bacterium]
MRVRIINLKHSYKSGRQIIQPLKNINLELEPLQTHALVGVSGAGKSTLFHILSGIIHPEEGRIFYDDLEWTALSPDEKNHYRSLHIGIVFQNHLLLPYLTAWENLTLPLKITGKWNASSEQKAWDLLKELQLQDRAHHLASQLSGGESQRVAIARAVITEPRLILADEPTGQLDEDSAEHTITLLFNLSQRFKATLFVITHDFSIANRCQTIWRLSKGIVYCEKS